MVASPGFCLKKETQEMCRNSSWFFPVPPMVSPPSPLAGDPGTVMGTVMSIYFQCDSHRTKWQKNGWFSDLPCLITRHPVIYTQKSPHTPLEWGIYFTYMCLSKNKLPESLSSFAHFLMAKPKSYFWSKVTSCPRIHTPQAYLHHLSSYPLVIYHSSGKWSFYFK